MKKILFILISLISFFSCGNNNEKIVTKFMQNIKEFKIDESKQYLSNPEIFDGISFEYKNKTQAVFFDSLFRNLEYDVLGSTKREDKNYVVNVKITNVDVEKVFSTVYKNIFKKSFLGENDVKIEEVFYETLKEDNVPKKTIISQFLITNIDGENKILLRKSNIDDIFGSYFSTLINISTE